MEHCFNVQAGGIDFKINSMNVKLPSLFQVYVMENGIEKRYHIKRDGGQLIFALRSDCPQALLNIEEELGDLIRQRYNL